MTNDTHPDITDFDHCPDCDSLLRGGPLDNFGRCPHCDLFIRVTDPADPADRATTRDRLPLDDPVTHRLIHESYRDYYDEKHTPSEDDP